jgi:hypothetical protein
LKLGGEELTTSVRTIHNYTKRGKRGVDFKSASPGKPLFWLTDVIAFEQGAAYRQRQQNEQVFRRLNSNSPTLFINHLK